MRFAQFSVWILIFCPLVTFGEEDLDLPSPKVKVTWVGARGKTFTLNWPMKSAWVLKEQKGPPYQQLVIRTWFAVPIKYQLKKFNWRRGYRLNPKDSPLGSKQVLSFDMAKLTESGSIDILAKGQTTQYGLIASMRNAKPFPWMSQSCRERGFSVKQWSDEGDNLFFAVNCVKRGKKLEVYFQNPLDTEMAVKASGALKARKKDYRVYTFHLSQRPKGRKAIGAVRLKTKSKLSPQSSFYNIYWGEKVARRAGWSYSAALGPTYLAYKEGPVSPVDINDRSIVVTVKGNALYTFNRKWDFGGNIFGNVLTLSHTHEGVPAARFYGASIRGGYTYLEKPSVILKTMVGAYFWGMWGVEGRYGVRYQGGPQLFLAAAFPQLLPRPAWLYLKFAFLGEGLDFGFSNRELAGGLAYEISSKASRRQIAVTLDIAHVALKLDTALNQIELSSLSLGLQIGLGRRR